MKCIAKQYQGGLGWETQCGTKLFLNDEAVIVFSSSDSDCVNCLSIVAK